MSELTVKLREWATHGTMSGNLPVKVDDLLELINAVEDAELDATDVSELDAKVTTYRRSIVDYQQRISEIRSLPKYLLDKHHGVEKTPVGDYIRVEDVEAVTGGCEL